MRWLSFSSPFPWLLRWIDDDSVDNSHRCFRFLVVSTLMTAAALLALGPVVDRFFAVADIPILLDGGWRVLQGQVPHRDFYTPLGPVMPLIMATGMNLGGVSASGIVFAKALVFVLVSFWAWGIGRSKMAAPFCLAFALYESLMVGSAYGYGSNRYELTYSGLYNRYGLALTGLVFMEALAIAKKKPETGISIIEGMSTGAALVVLFFLKASFFGVGLLGLTAGVILFPQHRTRWCGLLIGATISSVAMLWYLHFDLFAVQRDLVMAAGSRSTFTGSDLLNLVIDQNLVNWALLLALLCWITPVSPTACRSWISPEMFKWFLALLFVTAQILVHLSTTAAFVATLFPLAALLLAESARRFRHDTPTNELAPDTNLTPSVIALALSAFLVVSIVLPDIRSIPYAAYVKMFKARRLTEKQAFASISMNNLVVLDEQAYVKYINNGLDLLRSHLRPADRIVTLDFSNPFSFAFQQPSPHGDALWWHAGITFTKKFHPAPEKVFQEASLVMMPKTECLAVHKLFPAVTGLSDIYLPFVHDHFELLAQSEYWTLYRKKNIRLLTSNKG